MPQSFGSASNQCSPPSVRPLDRPPPTEPRRRFCDCCSCRPTAFGLGTKNPEGAGRRRRSRGKLSVPRTDIAGAAVKRLQCLPGPQLIPVWTTERTSRFLTRTIVGHSGGLRAAAVTADGKIVSADGDGMLRVWDPGVAPDPDLELGRHGPEVRALALTKQGSVVSGGRD